MDFATLAPFALALGVAGLVAGLAAGLFGIGGGIVIVPTLYHVFGALGVADETRMHAAVATSLATIVVTSARSVQAHHRKGAVEWAILRSWGPWIVAGALTGALVSRAVSGEALAGVFGVGALIVAARMAFARAPDAVQTAAAVAPHDRLPAGPTRAGLGAGLGFFSAWMGIGGGVFGVALLTMFGRPIHRAIGTAAGFGAAIGLPGALGFVIAGWGLADRPPASLGYVNVPGFVLIAALTSVTAPLGARLAHSLSQTMMKRAFAGVLTLVALNMLIDTGRVLIGAG